MRVKIRSLAFIFITTYEAETACAFCRSTDAGCFYEMLPYSGVAVVGRVYSSGRL